MIFSAEAVGHRAAVQINEAKLPAALILW